MIPTSQLPTHPRPQLTRPGWISLDGEWQFAFGQVESSPSSVQFDRQIHVPYAPESKASGVHDQGFHETVWYARDIRVTLNGPTQRVLLHFGAVDHQATVWVNGQRCGEHRGGHTSFWMDITDALQDGHGRVVVRADDQPTAFDLPRGKQNWRDEPHAIWYPRTTGIWQTVWIEQVPSCRVASVECTPNLTQWGFDVSAEFAGILPAQASVRVKLSVGGTCLSDDTFTLTSGRVKRRVYLTDPGIVDERKQLLWSPEHPQLIDVLVQLLGDGQVMDEVASYTAMRDVRIVGGEFRLNGAGYVPRLVLDQGYWPDSLMTATDEQFQQDVRLTKQLGFNGARKHQKIESPRYLYWCDVLGLLVWEEMPSAYSLTDQSVRDLSSEWLEAIKRDRGHPCIMAWVPLNESWGVPDLPENPQARSLLHALYHLTRAADPTRPVISNDGWEHGPSDILGIHDYSSDPQALLGRYGTDELAAHTLRTGRAKPYGHAFLLEPEGALEGPVMLTEFGGSTFSDGIQGGWGYSLFNSSETFLQQYEALLGAVHSCAGLKGFCYTQLTDTFNERNGLLTEEREFKADAVRLAAATRGPHRTELYVEEGQGAANPFGYEEQWLHRLAQKAF